MRAQQALVEIGRERLSGECRGCLPDTLDRENLGRSISPAVAGPRGVVGKSCVIFLPAKPHAIEGGHRVIAEWRALTIRARGRSERAAAGRREDG